MVSFKKIRNRLWSFWNWDVIPRLRYVHSPIKTYRDWKDTRDDLRAFGPGTLIENCNYHPCIVLRIDEFGDIDAWDLIGQHETSCSLWHCGIVKLTPDEVQECLRLHRDGGNKALAMNRGWSPENYDQFEKTWRSPSEEPPSF